MSLLRRYPAAVVAVPIGTVLGLAELASDGSPLRALAVFAIVVGFAVVVTLLSGRSETASALAGRRVDERLERVNIEAMAAALNISAIVVLVAFAVAEVTGGDPLPYGFMGAVMGIAYVGSLAVVQARH